ncbi:MAG: MCE family protein [Actinomycetota bacterium]|nr:MCE family protein [Actinomycetota bacterium]
MRLRTALGLLVAGAALAAGCTLPGQIEGPVEITATFSDVGDLVSGHSVQVADVRVGSVTGIELTDDFEARVTMRIKDGLDLPADSLAVLRTTSLLGEKFVELRPPAEAGSDDLLVDGSAIAAGNTQEAPELEFVADEAVQVLGAVAGNDLQTLVETGGIGFGGRAAELGSVLDSLSVVSATLADQTDNIVTIIDGLDQTTRTLATGTDDLDALLVNLEGTTRALADNRELALQTLRDLTRLARAQNDQVFGPYRDQLDQQVKQLDAIVALVAAQRGEVATLVDWLVAFTAKAPKGIPDDFAQVYGWFELAPLEDG